MKPKKTFFSERLKKIMFEKHITQKELADKLGFIQQRISFWATGRTSPTVNSIQKIAKALDVDVNYFIENANNGISENEKDIKILKLEKEILELKLQIEKLKKK